MGIIKSKEIQKTEILRCEAEINNLWGELNTANIPHQVRKELEQKLGGCEEQFKGVLGGQSSMKELEKKLHEVDFMLAVAAVNQAQNEIPKIEHDSSSFLALKTVKRELEEKKMTPQKARHEVKEIIRHHH